MGIEPGESSRGAREGVDFTSLLKQLRRLHILFLLPFRADIPVEDVVVMC